MKMVAFWVVAACSLVGVKRRFGGAISIIRAMNSLAPEVPDLH
jgi:hypothetical protein